MGNTRERRCSMAGVRTLRQVASPGQVEDELGHVVECGHCGKYSGKVLMANRFPPSGTGEDAGGGA